MKKILIVLLMLCTTCFAQTFDFNSKGEEDANEILKEYVEKNLEIEDADTVAYNYDVDSDGKKEVIGIVKAAPFYTPAGYQLFIIKKNGDDWQNVKSDIYFDNYKDLTVDSNEIKYQKSYFYKNKKYKAKYKKDEYITGKRLFDHFANKQANAVQYAAKIQTPHTSQVMDVEDLKGSEQPSFYLDLTDGIVSF